MRRIWGEFNKRILWRKLWVILAEVQAEYDLVSPKQLADLRAHSEDIDIERAEEIEVEVRHDLMAELKTFAEQAPLGGTILHLGATSADIQDNVDVLRIRQSTELILQKLKDLLLSLVEKIEAWSDTPVMAFTHLQPAEPTTLGLRMSVYAQDLFLDWQLINNLKSEIKGKGFRGAVGTGASYAELIGTARLAEFHSRLSKRLDLKFFPISTQVYPRKQDYIVLSGLAGLGGSLNKLAFDLRVLQSPTIGELFEPFDPGQVGSSAMPFKKNPVNSEKINSLARILAQMPRVAWDNFANSLLERTLDDSANRRVILPEGFLIVDELLETTIRIVKGLKLDQNAVARNLAVYGPFAGTERVLMALSKAGADRQEMHERLRVYSMESWKEIQTEGKNSLAERIGTDPIITNYLTTDQLSGLMDIKNHIGDAPNRARMLALEIKKFFE